MLKEERVKQLYKVALYEQKEEKLHKQIRKYYSKDYIAKEMLKSIFTGTIAYLLIVVLAAVTHWEVFLKQVNALDINGMIGVVLVIYLLYMGSYMGATYLFYRSRYADARKYLDEYEEELRVLHNMYEREEKLKH